MKKYYLILLVLIIVGFFHATFINGLLPIPSDALVGLYHPYRDFYAKEFPRGVPFTNSLITDPIRQQYPWKFLSMELLKKVQLPLWNPYNFSGYPLMANLQSAAFYPLNILFFLLPFSVGWTIFIVLQPLLAGIFMYFFLKNIRLHASAALLGSLAFAFCGFFVSWMEWGNVVQTGLWLPLMLMSIDKCMDVHDRKQHTFLEVSFSLWHMVFFAAIVCSFLAGHLQVFFYECVVLLCYFLIRLFDLKQKKQLLFAFGIISLIVILILSFQIIPLFQFIGLSARNVDQISTNQPGWFVPWQNIAQFIAPDFFGNPATINYWGVWNYGEFIGYIGIVPLLFALYGSLCKKEKNVRFFAILFVLSLLFALPTIFAKIPYKFSFPFISTSQPTRLMYLADFSLCVLSAFGFDLFLKQKKKMFIPLGIVGFVIVLFWVIAYANSYLPGVFHITAENLVVTKNNIKLPSIIFFMSAIILIAVMYIKPKRIQLIFFVLLFSLVIFDLHRFTTKYISFASEKYLYPQTKLFDFLTQQPGIFRVMETNAEILPPNFSVLYHIQTIDGYDPLYLRRYAEFISAMDRNRPDINPPFYFYRIITPETYGAKFINLLNVKYVLSLTPINSPSFKQVFSEGQTSVYENLNVMDRSFFVANTKSVARNQETIAAMFASSYSPRSTALITDENDTHLNNMNWSVGVSNIVSYAENKIVIETKNQGDGFLVLTDSYYPTWHATIDGRETKIFIADYNFRGIVVPSGNHTIVFADHLF